MGIGRLVPSPPLPIAIPNGKRRAFAWYPVNTVCMSSITYETILATYMFAWHDSTRVEYYVAIRMIAFILNCVCLITNFKCIHYHGFRAFCNSLICLYFDKNSILFYLNFGHKNMSLCLRIFVYLHLLSLSTRDGKRIRTWSNLARFVRWWEGQARAYMKSSS